MKNTPGCTCCADDCLENCYFPCANASDEFGCKFCGIDIQMPTPNAVGKLLQVDDDECPDTAPCFACYIVYDKLFNFFNFSGTCGSWKTAWPVAFGYADQYVSTPELGAFIPMFKCWIPSTYSCPYDTDLAGKTCSSSNIAIGFPPRYPSPGNPILQARNWVEMTGPEWDGECGTITLVVRYTVFEFEASYSEVPIGGGGGCEEPKWTQYEYTFKLDYCNCEDLLQPFTFDSAFTNDSCAGSVADPCNFEDAVIKLKPSDPVGATVGYCVQCACVNCEGYDTSQFLVTVSGPQINGTFVVDNAATFVGGFLRELTCLWEGAPATVSGGCVDRVYFQLYITCLECDKMEVSARMWAANPGDLSFRLIYEGKTDPFDCGDTPTFTQTFSNGECGIDAHTIQMQFVPA